MSSYKLHCLQGLCSGPQTDFLCCVQINFGMEVTFDTVLQTHSVTVCSKQCAFLRDVRDKTKCAILADKKQKKQVFLCPQNLCLFHDKTAPAFSLLQTIESFKRSLLSKPLRLVLQSLHQGCATRNREREN